MNKNKKIIFVGLKYDSKICVHVTTRSYDPLLCPFLERKPTKTLTTYPLESRK